MESIKIADGINHVTTCTEFHEAGCFPPEEELEPKRKEVQQLAEAGRQWAAGDKHPWKIFVTSLHGMFLAVLRALKLKDDESGLLFPVSAQHEKRDTYPWHQL